MYESVGNVVMQMRYECVEVRTHAYVAGSSGYIYSRRSGSNIHAWSAAMVSVCHAHMLLCIFAVDKLRCYKLHAYRTCTCRSCHHAMWQGNVVAATLSAHVHA